MQEAGRVAQHSGEVLTVEAPVRIDLKLCKGCGICVALCSRDVLAADGQSVKVIAAVACSRCRLCELARSAGATYVARGTVYRYRLLAELIAGGIAHQGFSFVEVMVSCPTYYGRQNDPAGPSEMLLRQRERGISVERFEQRGPRRQERYPVGVLHHVERTEYLSAYREVIRRAQGA
jgi:pyruvate/2-oxoacid:ferredoxin oxidoreductase beta subunit